jgi:Helicase conserved C-terminal domain
MIDTSLVSLKKKLEQERALIPLVAQVWEVSVQGLDRGSSIIALIVKNMQDAHVARSVWEHLSSSERLCLFHLFGDGNPDKHKGITLESLRKKTKLSSEVVEEAVESLRARWYLVDTGTISTSSSLRRGPQRLEATLELGVFPYRESFQQLWHTGQEIFGSEADRSTFSLEQLIGTFEGERLRYLADLCRVPLYVGVYPYKAYSSYSYNAAQTQEIQKRVYEALSHPLMPLELLRQLASPAQEVFFWLCEQGGKVKMEEVRSYMAARSLVAPLAVISSLEAHALAFDTFTSDGVRWLFIPSDLLAVVKREVQYRAEDDLHYTFSPLEGVEAPQESQPLLLYDLAVVIGMSVQMIIEPTKEGKLPKKLREKIRPLLHGRVRKDDEGNDLYVDQVFRAAQKMELLECVSPTEEEKRRYLRGPKLASWSELTRVDQARELVKWWRGTSSWLDVRFDGRAFSASSVVHQALLDLLKQCVPEQWYRMDVLLYAIFRQGPWSFYDPYAKKQSSPPSWHSQRALWMQGGGRMYVSLLASFLSELGIVSLASLPLPQASEESQEIFCVTSFGAAVLETIPAQSDVSVLDARQPALILQPNYEILLMEFDTNLVYKLLAIAEPVRIGTVSTFRLTKLALLNGLASGVLLEDALAFLASHTTQKELPQNVVYTIKDWAKAYREFRLTEVIMVETPGNETMEEIRRLLGNLSGELRHVGSGLFLVSSAKASFGDVRKRLRQAGIVVRGEPSKVSSKR